MKALSGLSRIRLKQYLIITGNYWAFTLTDGALTYAGGFVFSSA